MSVRDGKVKLMLSAKDSARKLEIEKAQRKYDVACREHTDFIGSLPAKKNKWTILQKDQVALSRKKCAMPAILLDHKQINRSSDIASWSRPPVKRAPRTMIDDDILYDFCRQTDSFAFKLPVPLRKFIYTCLTTLKIPNTNSRKHAKEQLALLLASKTQFENEVEEQAIPEAVTQDDVEVSRLPLRLELHNADNRGETFYKCIGLIARKSAGKYNSSPNGGVSMVREFARLNEDLFQYGQSVYYVDRTEHKEETFREYAERFYGGSFSPIAQSNPIDRERGPMCLGNISNVRRQALSSPSLMNWRKRYDGVHAAAAIVTETHHLYDYDHTKGTYEQASTCILVDAYGCTHTTLDSTFMLLVSHIVDTNASRVKDIDYLMFQMQPDSMFKERLMEMYPCDHWAAINGLEYIGIRFKTAIKLVKEDKPFLAHHSTCQSSARVNVVEAMENSLYFLKGKRNANDVPFFCYKSKGFGLVRGFPWTLEPDTNAGFQRLAEGASTMFGLPTNDFKAFYNTASSQSSNVAMDSQMVESYLKKKVNNLGYSSSSITDKSTCAWQAFCWCVPSKAAHFFMLGKKLEYSNIRISKKKSAGDVSSTLIELMDKNGYHGKYLFKENNMSDHDRLQRFIANTIQSTDIANSRLIVVLRDSNQATRHCVGVDIQRQMISPGYELPELELSQSSLDACCGIGMHCTGISTVLCITKKRKSTKKRKKAHNGIENKRNK
jgi:hypothetical protein